MTKFFNVGKYTLQLSWPISISFRWPIWLHKPIQERLPQVFYTERDVSEFKNRDITQQPMFIGSPEAFVATYGKPDNRGFEAASDWLNRAEIHPPDPER